MGPSFTSRNACRCHPVLSGECIASTDPSTMLASRLLFRQLERQLLSRHVHSPFHPPVILPRARAFHTSTPRKAALDVFLALPHGMLESIHAAGIPWYATLPISAFVVRGLLVTTLGSYIRSLTSRYMALHPLRHAISLQIRDRLMKTGGFTSPDHAKRAIANEINKEARKLDSRWGCTLRGQVGWTFAQLPLFLAMAEVVRRMCGTKDGLLKMATNAIGLGEESTSKVGIIGGEYAADVALNPWFEPSMATEGMLWFPDLLVADPTGVLPFVVSGIMFTNIYISKNASGNTATASAFSRRLRRGLLFVALLIGPLSQHVPAGLLLYWASSTSSVMLWNVWLDWKYPVVKHLFAPCKRPLLMMPPRTPNRTSSKLRSR